jgi:hypothetical protein
MDRIVVYSLIILLTPVIANSYPEGWSDDVLLTPETSGYRFDPDISVDSYNNVWVVWDSNFWGSGYVYYSKWDSLGNCIISGTPLPDSTQSSHGQTKIVVDNSDNVHIQWTEPSPIGPGIGYTKLDNSGSILVNPHLALPGYGTGTDLRHEIAIDKQSNINVVWVEVPSGVRQISYTKLDSLGDTLIARIQVSPITFSSFASGIGVDSFGNVHMAYRTDTTGTSDRLTYSKLDEDGNMLIDNKTLGFGYRPTIICDRNQNVHMVYGHHISTGNCIDYLKLDQAGNFLVLPKTISIHDNNNYVHMAMDSTQYLHVVWHLENPMGIMYTKLDTMGDYVISPMMVVYQPYAVWPAHPRVAVDRSNRLHLTWVDQRFGHSDIFYKRGENETGISEIQRLRVEKSPRISVFPSPFSGMTKISFELSRSTINIRFEIFDIAGRVVKDFISPKPKGFVYWDGTDNVGDRLPAGVYFLRISSREGGTAVPIVWLR